MTAEVRVDELQRAIRNLSQQMSMLTAKVDGLEIYVGRVLGSFEDRMSRELNDEIRAEMNALEERTGGRLDAMEQKLDRMEARLEASIATVDDHVAGVIAEMHRMGEETTRRFDKLETLIRERLNP